MQNFIWVEEAGGGRGRERPWQATALYTSWPNVAETPELGQAAEAFERLVVARYAERLEAWIAQRRTEPAVWQEAAAFGDTLLYLTVEELAELRDSLAALAKPYEERLTRHELRPATARPVVLLQLAFLDEES